MSVRATVALALACCTLGLPAAAQASRSTGTPEQIAWVRRAARNFVGDELARNAAGACSILNAPLRASRHGRSCEQRWSARIAARLSTAAGRRRLHGQLREIARATVTVRGNVATLGLKTALFTSPANRFLWTEMCWMLEG